MDFVYLDNNATTQPAQAVVQAVEAMQRQHWANASSIHRLGQTARQKVELARAQVARLIHCHDRDLVFTSGGTESDNLALKGILLAPAKSGSGPSGGATSGGNGSADHRVLITSRMEHSAVVEPADELGAWGIEVLYLPPDNQGRVSAADLAKLLNSAGGPGVLSLVSIQWANNETGVIQPVEELVAACRAEGAKGQGRRVVFHSDATQAVGKIPVDVSAVAVDLLTFSAHKFHGPKGIGGLYVRPGVRLRPQQRGGPHERQRRAGTENTAGIVGMGEAAQAAMAFLAEPAGVTAIQELRDHLEQGIGRAVPEAVVHSAAAPRLWNTSNIGFPGLEAEALLLTLSEMGVCVSAGAACSSGSLEPSPVLRAMGVPEPVAHGSLRFSLSRFTTAGEIDRAVEAVAQAVEKLRRCLPLYRGS